MHQLEVESDLRANRRNVTHAQAKTLLKGEIMTIFQRWGDLPRTMQNSLIRHCISSLKNVIQEAYEITRSPAEYQQVLLNMQLSGELPIPGSSIL